MTTSETAPMPAMAQDKSPDRARGLSRKEFFDRYVIPNKPVVFEDASAHWPALKKWSPEFWIKTYGDKQVRVDGKDFPLKEIVKGALDSKEGSPSPYYRNVVLQTQYPELLADVSPPPEVCTPNWLPHPLFRPARLATKKFGIFHELFIGGKGASFPYMHFDDPGTHTFIHQLWGKKQFVMFAPSDTPFLYQGEGEHFAKSRIKNLQNVDLKEYPLFAKATQYSVVLGAGDTLFIPCGWWHTARMVDYSLTVGTDMLNHTNWDHFINYQRRKLKSRNKLMGAAYLAYLRFAGGLMSLSKN